MDVKYPIHGSTTIIWPKSKINKRILLFVNFLIIFIIFYGLEKSYGLKTKNSFIVYYYPNTIILLYGRGLKLALEWYFSTFYQS